MSRKIIFVTLLFSAVLALAACGGATPTTAPTTVPTATSAPATAVPVTATSSPTPLPAATATVAPATAASPTNPPTTSASGTPADPITALAKLEKADSFRLDAQAHVSKDFFQGRYTPASGEDPNTVTIFTVKGMQKASDLHYDVGGFVSSLMGLFNGFAPNNPNLEVIVSGGRQYMHGIRAGTTEAKWYVLPEDQAANQSFDASGFWKPFVSGQLQAGDLKKTGTETLDNQSCDVYTASRKAFDNVFPEVSSSSVLDSEKIDLAAVDTFEYMFWVCDDGSLHQVRYAFGAHDKANPSQKGTFTYLLHISDYDGDITVAAPPDAAPLNTGTPNQETPAPGATSPANASKKVSLGSRDSNVTIADNGDVTFREAWLVEFDGGPFSSAFRSIPLKNTSGVSDWGVSESGEDYMQADTGAPKTFQVADDSSNSKMTWHFTPRTNDTGIFLVGYTVNGSVARDTTGNDWTWTIVEPDRDYSIGPTEILVHLPAEFDTSQITASAKLDDKESAKVEIVDGSTVKFTDGPFPPGSTWILRIRYPAAAATPEPTSATSADSISIVKSFFDAINSKNLDSALAIADNNIIYTVGNSNGIGKDALKSYFSKGTTYTLSDLNSTGDVVGFVVKASDGKTYGQSSAILTDGKIQILTLQ